MKKILLLLITFVLLLNIQQKKLKVVIKTSFDQQNMHLISLNYPTTNNFKINAVIKNEVFKQQNLFNKNSNYYKELNIDFKYTAFNERYHNLILISEFKTLNTVNKKTILSIVYDDLTKRILTLQDFLKIQQPIYNFSIHSNYFKIYSQNNIKIIDHNIEFKNSHNNISNIFTPKKVSIEHDKKIALTFDDGPSIYTNMIIDTLKKYNAKATFFVLGNKVSNNQATLIKLLNEGHEIGNHTYNHKFLPNLTVPKIIDQVNKTQDLIYEKTNFLPTLFRPSYGSTSKKILENINLKIVLWNIDSLDWKIKNKTTIAKKVISKARPNSIILMHDTYARTANAVEIILDELTKQGYKFVTVSQLQKKD